MITPAFQAYPKEWLSNQHITMMTPAEEGAYWRLLCYAWLDPDCSIPDDDVALARLSRLEDQWVKGGYNVVKTRFKPHPTIPGRLINERLLREREKQRVWRDRSSLGGKKSAIKRWGKPACEQNKGGYKMVTPCLRDGDNQTVTLQSPVCSLLTSTPLSPNREVALEIYNAYPRKVGKPVALRAIQKALKKMEPAVLLSRTKAFALASAGDDPKFIPHPSTWFNQERFNDDQETWKAPASPPSRELTQAERDEQTLHEAL